MKNVEAILAAAFAAEQVCDHANDVVNHDVCSLCVRDVLHQREAARRPGASCFCPSSPGEDCRATAEECNARTAVIDELLAALNGLRRGNCFCEHGIGNPMYRDHSDACRRATKAVASGRAPLVAESPDADRGAADQKEHSR